ncbi:hypothetical protein ABBQ38_013058 [Trebouxia sp. C0009 RCD-2024]
MAAICTDDYLSIARRHLSGFGILQCRNGHHLCKQCWSKLPEHKCPTCRVDMSEPVPLRVLEDDVRGHKASCRWAGCRQGGLTLGTKREHEMTCSQKLLSCVCGFRGISASQIVHQKACITHHLSPVQQEVHSLQKSIKHLMSRIDSLESSLADVYMDREPSDHDCGY